VLSINYAGLAQHFYSLAWQRSAVPECAPRPSADKIEMLHILTSVNIYSCIHIPSAYLSGGGARENEMEQTALLREKG
jgi:hypothetical protein